MGLKYFLHSLSGIQNFEKTPAGFSTSASLFTELKTQESPPNGYPATQDIGEGPVPDWLLFISFGLLIVLAWIKLIYNRFLDHIFKATVNYQLAEKVFQAPSVMQKRISFISLVIYFISGGLYGFLLCQHFQWFPFGVKGFNLFALLSGLLVFLVLLRLIIMHVTGYLFKKNQLFSEYLFHHFLFNKVMGVLLLPLIILIAYTEGIVLEVVIYTSFAVVGVIFIGRIIRIVYFIFKNVVSLFYLILYLCTLEILPLAVLIKVILSLEKGL